MVRFALLQYNCVTAGTNTYTLMCNCDPHSLCTHTLCRLHDRVAVESLQSGVSYHLFRCWKATCPFRGYMTCSVRHWRLLIRWLKSLSQLYKRWLLWIPLLNKSRYIYIYIKKRRENKNVFFFFLCCHRLCFRKASCSMLPLALQWRPLGPTWTTTWNSLKLSTHLCR